MVSRSVGVALVLLAIGSTVATADVLRLRDGQVIEGTISAVTDTYVTIVTDTGARDYPVAAIESIERSTAPVGASTENSPPEAEREEAGNGIHPGVGIGIEALAGQPLLAVRIGFQGLSVGAAGTVLSEDYYDVDYTMSFSVLLFTSDVSFYLSLVDNVCDLYIGAGVDGGVMWVSECYYGTCISGSGVGLGATARGGLQFSLFSVGVPIVFYGGASWLSLQSITVMFGGYSESMPINLSGLTWHIGVMVAF